MYLILFFVLLLKLLLGLEYYLLKLLSLVLKHLFIRQTAIEFNMNYCASL